MSDHHRLRPVELVGKAERLHAVYLPWECVWCGKQWEVLPPEHDRRNCPASPW